MWQTPLVIFTQYAIMFLTCSPLSCFSHLLAGFLTSHLSANLIFIQSFCLIWNCVCGAHNCGIKMIFQRLLEYIWQDTAILIVLLQNVMFNQMCYFHFFLIFCEIYQQFMSENHLEVNTTPIFVFSMEHLHGSDALLFQMYNFIYLQSFVY